jgi:hypothetical protein
MELRVWDHVKPSAEQAEAVQRICNRVVRALGVTGEVFASEFGHGTTVINYHPERYRMGVTNTQRDEERRAVLQAICTALIAYDFSLKQDVTRWPEKRRYIPTSPIHARPVIADLSLAEALEFLDARREDLGIEIPVIG